MYPFVTLEMLMHKKGTALKLKASEVTPGHQRTFVNVSPEFVNLCRTTWQKVHRKRSPCSAFFYFRRKKINCCIKKEALLAAPPPQHMVNSNPMTPDLADLPGYLWEGLTTARLSQ